MNENMVCVVCGQEERIGIASYNPGCCGRWSHQDCLMKVISEGCQFCGSCQTPFPEFVLLMAEIGKIPTVQAEAVPAPVVARTPLSPTYQRPVFTPRRTNSLRNLPVQSSTQHTVDDVDDDHATYHCPLVSEEPTEPWVPTQPISMSGINMHCTAEYKIIPSVTIDSFYAVVSMEAAALATATSAVDADRPPMDIICVLDTSGSMADYNKLKSLKVAMKYIISTLNEKDRLSLVSFESSSKVIHPLARTTASNKAIMNAAVNSLSANGGTRILAGLKSALDLLNRRQYKNPVTTVFLLTDGIDSSESVQKLNIAKTIKELGGSLYVFGFGNDHDSAHLKGISDAAEGLFAYVEKSENVVEAFGGAIGADCSICAVNLCLTIHSIDNVKISDVYCGNYKYSIDNASKCAKVHFNNLLSGERRDILVTLSFPSAQNEGQYLLFDSSLAYQPVGYESEVPLQTNCETCSVWRSHTAPLDQERELRVDEQVNRMIMKKATEESLQRADNNDFQGAQTCMRNALFTMQNSCSMRSRSQVSMTLASDLESSIQNVSDYSSYNRNGGRSMMSEVTQTVTTQRSPYVGRSHSSCLYQSPSSSRHQRAANLSRPNYE